MYLRKHAALIACRRAGFVAVGRPKARSMHGAHTALTPCLRCLTLQASQA